jgi:hypothetical protein
MVTWYVGDLGTTITVPRYDEISADVKITVTNRKAKEGDIGFVLEIRDPAGVLLNPNDRGTAYITPLGVITRDFFITSLTAGTTYTLKAWATTADFTKALSTVVTKTLTTKSPYEPTNSWYGGDLKITGLTISNVSQNAADVKVDVLNYHAKEGDIIMVLKIRDPNGNIIYTDLVPKFMTSKGTLSHTWNLSGLLNPNTQYSALASAIDINGKIIAYEVTKLFKTMGPLAYPDLQLTSSIVQSDTQYIKTRTVVKNTSAIHNGDFILYSQYKDKNGFTVEMASVSETLGPSESKTIDQSISSGLVPTVNYSVRIEATTSDMTQLLGNAVTLSGTISTGVPPGGGSAGGLTEGQKALIIGGLLVLAWSS